MCLFRKVEVILGEPGVRVGLAVQKSREMADGERGEVFGAEKERGEGWNE